MPYINSSPHIGHAFEFILADCITRYLRINGIDVHFNIGLDEHGNKVWLKSQELEIDIEKYIENLTNIWLDFCQKFNINYDTFYKTSDEQHHKNVKIIWNRFVNRGDIYKKSYEGKYCIGCESFKLDKELVNGKCSDHPTTKIDIISEENYFFKLTKYKDSILSWIISNPEVLKPSSKIEELKNLIIGSEDISISRLKKNCPWGVDVPGDDNQVIYVWFDALLNYIFAAGYLTDNFNWNNVIQLCGPDNLRFQGLIFQSFLESENIKKTNKLLVHGTVLDKNGKKISKTLGNTIDPIDQLNKYGIDAVRYYSVCGLSNWNDSNWNESDLVNLFNNDICNDWGNLVARVLHLIDTKSVNINYPEDNYKSLVLNNIESINNLWNEFQIKEALQKTNELSKLCNKYINDEKPWKSDNYEIILNNLFFTIEQINKLYYPIFPERCNELDLALKEKRKIILFNKI